MILHKIDFIPSPRKRGSHCRAGHSPDSNADRIKQVDEDKTEFPVYLIAENHERIASLPVFPHPSPLPKGEGIHRYGFISPRAYTLGYTHGAPLALKSCTANW